jgi:hypothetical protein
MKITVELNVRDDARQEDLGYWLWLGQALDAKPIIGEMVSFTQTGPVADQSVKASQPDDKAVHTTSHGEGPEAGADEGEDDAADEPQPTGNLPPGVSPPAATASRRGPRAGGRKKAQTAEQQVEALAEKVNGVDASPATPEQPQTNMPPGVTMPSGMPPGVSPPAPSQPTPPAPAAAMPAALPPSAASANGEMNLEDFKAEVLTLYTAAQQAGLPAAYPFNVIRAEKWPDGSDKDFRTMVMDQVPLGARRKVVDQCVALLSR